MPPDGINYPKLKQRKQTGLWLLLSGRLTPYRLPKQENRGSWLALQRAGPCLLDGVDQQEPSVPGQADLWEPPRKVRRAAWSSSRRDQPIFLERKELGLDERNELIHRAVLDRDVRDQIGRGALGVSCNLYRLSMGSSSAFRRLGHQPPCGVPLGTVKSSAARSAPVCSPLSSTIFAARPCALNGPEVSFLVPAQASASRCEVAGRVGHGQSSRRLTERRSQQSGFPASGGRATLARRSAAES